MSDQTDPMLLIARDCVASSMHDRDRSWAALVLAGERDDCPEMRMVLRALQHSDVAMPVNQRCAMEAASQCAEALPALIHFAREGEDHPGPFGHGEPIEKLADALKMTIEVAAACGDTDSDRDQLLAALVRFLEGWAG